MPSTEELFKLEAAAEKAGLCNALIRDAGHTQIAAGALVGYLFVVSYSVAPCCH